MRQLDPIAKDLRIVRERKNMPQKVLAHKAGYSIQTIRQWEQGRRSPPLRAIRNWLEALNCEIVIRDLS